MNPIAVGLNVGIKVNVNINCENQKNLPCSGVEVRGSYVTTSNT